MWSFIFSIIWLLIISSIPIVLWGYLFAYMDNRPLSKTRFISGIWGWLLALLPIWYFSRQLPSGISWYEGLTRVLEGTGMLQSTVYVFFFLLVLVCILWGLSYLFGLIFYKARAYMAWYIKSIVILAICGWLISGLWYISSLAFLFFPDWNRAMSWEVTTPLVLSLQWLFLYYLVVGIMEEAAKHFNMIPVLSSPEILKKNIVLYAIFVALGFSWIENMIYAYSYILHHGMDQWFLTNFLYRSIFSVMVHVFASSVIAYYFAAAIAGYKKNKNILSYLKIFLFWFVCGILLHSWFDISLTLWWWIFIVIYFIAGYLYLTSILYREE